MKKLKTTIAATAALAACVSTPLFAQNTKEDTITFSLTLQGQSSVSSSATSANAGTWFSTSTLKDGTVVGRGPTHYKTSSKKLTQVDLLRAIGVVLHGNGDGKTGANYYSSQAKLVLVQGELSGFFNITPDLAGSIADTNLIYDMDGVLVDTAGFTGGFVSDDIDADTSLAGSFDSTYAQLATGRHFEPVENGSTSSGTDDWGTEFNAFPPGHMQPWGQIYVKDPTKSVECENVTYFFALTVQECYDCFYLNSFISDANFSFQAFKGQSGPPCCSLGAYMVGKGTDKYYLTLSFDNTENNPYLYEYSGLWVGAYGLNPFSGLTGVTGLDGITPDALDFASSISSQLGRPSPYEVRFTLNGIVTYNWNLQLINTSDAAPDFVGTASYAANGYGFVGLICQLITGSATFSEKLVKTSTCCLGEPWYDNWYGIGAYADPFVGPYLNAYFDYYYMPQATPLNVPASLTYHGNFNEGYEPWAVAAAELLNYDYYINNPVE